MTDDGLFHCEALQEAALGAAGAGAGEAHDTFRGDSEEQTDKHDQWLIEHGVCPDCLRTFARQAEVDMEETGARPGHIYLGAFVTAWQLAINCGLEPERGEAAERPEGGYVHTETGETVRIIEASPSKVKVGVQLSPLGDGEERERVYDRRYFDAHFVKGDQVEVLGGPDA